MRQQLTAVAAIAAISLALAGAGCGKTNQTGVLDKAKETFTSIRDAVDRSVALRCEYTDENGEKTIANIMGKQLRLDSENEGEQGKFHGVIKDNKMWIWADKSKEGMLIDFSKLTDDSLKMGEKPIRSTDDIIDKLEEKKDTCKTTTAAASLFETPSDVNFLGEDAVTPTTTPATK